jgi:hypothetical protein
MDTPCITCYEKWKYAIVVNIKEPFLKETDLFYEKFSVLSELVWGVFRVLPAGEETCAMWMMGPLISTWEKK